MPDLIELRQVTGDGQPGDLAGTAELAGDTVTYTGRIVEDTFRMLTRRHRRTPAEIFALMSRDGWSNGWLMATTPTPQ